MASASLAKAYDEVDPQPASNSHDVRFVRQTREQCSLEESLGRQVGQKSGDERLQTFGQKIASDYSQLGGQLTTLAPNEMKSAGTSPAKGDFSNLSGNKFDLAAMGELLRHGQKAIAGLDHEAMNGENSLLKQLALAALPVLQSDLDLGQNLYRQMKHNVKKSGGTNLLPITETN